MLQSLELPNEMRVSDTMLSAGQPDGMQFRQAADAGVQHVINLRPLQEQGEDESSLVEELGMRYHHLPIAGPQDLNADTVRMLDGLLSEIGSAPTVFHCASGNRVGAMLALRAAWHQGMDSDAALALGRQSGLTKMEPLVREILDSTPPAA
ncbi:beta-lactamase hydrolase domain-containing protein [Algiphilus sp.]|uniref:beta-lactamase hydrolase domain-containing protein n=1 Tax=Algiphilus sp. TaxID=1872431 RepID=UPI003B522B3B